MLDRPDAATLLDAVATYLEKDARPAIADPGLAFRALIAANLCRVVAAETRGGAQVQADSMATLATLLGHPVESVPEAETELAEQLRSGALSPTPAVVEAVMKMLAGELMIVSPRFDRALEIERR